MKLQLTKDKTIDVKMPWEKSAAGGSFGHRGPSDVTGVFLDFADTRGCPAVRLQRRKGTVQVVAAGFVSPPEGNLPTSWDDLHNQVKWSLPHAFQAPQAALAVIVMRASAIVRSICFMRMGLDVRVGGYLPRRSTQSL